MIDITYFVDNLFSKITLMYDFKDEKKFLKSFQNETKN